MLIGTMEIASKSKLNPRQELFCKYFASERELFGNGVESYMAAYEIDRTQKGAYTGARASASRLLTDANILARINELFESDGFTDVAVDKQLKFVINQNADFPSKVAAIREYNKLKQRITDKSEQLVVADVTSNGETVGTTDLDTIIAQVKKSTEA